jgi:L-seryl-tRNA(Ser) seleniumtransferase
MTSPVRDDPRRRIPPVDRILDDPVLERLIGVYGREAVRVQARQALEELREELAGAAPEAPPEAPAGAGADASVGALAQRVGSRVERAFGRPLVRALNATGIFIHTNLGRAPLPREVARELPALLDAYCNLEIDLETGRRSDRNRRARPLLAALTGAEDAAVVNNNAAAVVLALAALAGGGRRQVVVSRGELVEIGGSFRIPEMMAAAGADLVEVGTTNRVRLADYERAIGDGTALVLKVFPSNYRIVGFTAAVAAGELAALGRERAVPVMVDEGSGLLRPHPAPQLADHPSIAELVEAGCDLVTASGDKLLGGPQAGLLVGRRETVERLRRHPLYRALRPDRATYAALEAVLRRHLTERPMPIDRLWPDPDAHRRRLEAAAAALGGAVGPAAGAEVVPAEAFLGGGSAPERPIPGEALALPGGDQLLARLRAGEPPVVAYLREDRVLLDLRTVDPEDDPELVAAVLKALHA